LNFVSDDRVAAGENNLMKQIRWSTPLKGYREVGDYKLASFAEVAYSYPEGDLCYSTFRLSSIKYYKQ
jgi:hypothetical protein